MGFKLYNLDLGYFGINTESELAKKLLLFIK